MVTWMARKRKNKKAERPLRKPTTLELAKKSTEDKGDWRSEWGKEPVERKFTKDYALVVDDKVVFETDDATEANARYVMLEGQGNVLLFHKGRIMSSCSFI